MRNAKTAKKLFWMLFAANLVCLPVVQAQSSYSSDKGSNQGQLPAGKTVFDVLRELNQQKGVYFLFSNPELGKRVIPIVVDMSKDVERILREVLKSAGLKYKKVSYNTYVITDAKAESNNETDENQIRFADQLTTGALLENTVRKTFSESISGRVTNAKGQPVANASVTIKGTIRGASSNSNGQFSIQADKGDVLVISSVGYETYLVTITEETDLTIFLDLNNKEMNEVVVTALGVKKEARSLGYSTAKLDGEEFTKAREVNVGNALVGKVAGVNSSGPLTGPGGSSRVTIRGNNSLSGDNQPLYVVNGIPMNNDNLGSAGMWGGADLGDGLSSLNPDDVEDMTVLKGGAAAALYGQRGKNGVILITTKSGKGKKALGIELNSNVMFDKANDFTDFQDQYGQGAMGEKPVDQAAAMQTGLLSWGAPLDGTNSIIFNGQQKPYNYESGNNLKNYYRTGTTFTNTIAMTGGTEAAAFRLSFGDLRNSGIYPNSKYTRNNVNLDLNYKLSDKWSGQANLSYIKEVGKNRSNLSDAPGNGNYAILFLPPNIRGSYLAPGYDQKGNELLYNSDAFTTNPYFAAARFQNNTKKDRILGVASLRYAPVEWLYIQTRITNDFFAFNAEQITPTGTAYRPSGSLDNESTNLYNELNMDLLAGMNKTIGRDLSIGITAGGNLLKMNAKNTAVNANGLAFPYLYNPAAAATRNATVRTPKKEVQSVYGSVELGFRNTFFLNFTDRNDWSSSLPAENNSYNYPSVNAAWIFTENFKPAWLTFGKLRAGYAVVGGDAPIFSTVLYYNTNGSINGNPIGSIGNEIPNSAIEPLKVTELEIGTDLKLFDNRIFIEFSWYNKHTLNDIVQGTVSQTSGYANALVNVGKLENKGVELMIGGSPVKKKFFRWNTSFNYANNKNKVIELAEGQEFMDMGQSRTQRGFIQHRVGEAFSQVMVYDFKRNTKGVLLLNAGGLPQSTDALIAVGSGIHPVTGGWNNEFNYKNWGLSFLIDYKFGAVIYSGTNANAFANGLHKETLPGRETGIEVDGVDEAGNAMHATIDARTYYGALANVSRLHVYDADFIKFRSLSLTYNFPAKLLKNKLAGLNLSAVARNLFYIKRFTKNIDPESNYNNSNAQGLEYASLPSVRSVGINLNVKF
jgi:TonB-linked SusC/RagA family outer membrane protein